MATILKTLAALLRRAADAIDPKRGGGPGEEK